MSALMRNRGPDAEGFFFDGRIGLGHRRLTIIDLSAGEQPVFNEDRSKLVVFNGEIFNYQELTRNLQQLGHRFRTATDTEVIVHAYEEYGENCVDHFRGMFAFAIYDTRSGGLFLARDRLGIKPLYYTIAEGRLHFASEVKPLLLLQGGRGIPDPAAIDLFMSVGYVPGESTMFKGIKRLLPGHWMRWEPGWKEPRIRKYWDVPDGPVSRIGEAEAQERFAELLRESVTLRMISDVPLGAFLSGGVDSSVIVAQMQEISSRPVKTFSIGYSDSAEHNELPHARAVADHLRTDHTEYVLTHGDFFDDIASFVARSEEPIVESAGIALYHLARRARQDVTVVLSGEGGDEILAGYPLYQLMNKVDSVRRLLRPAGLHRICRPIARRVRSEKVAKYLDWIAQPLDERYHSIPNDVTPAIRDRLYADDFPYRAGSAVSQYFSSLFSCLAQASELKRMSYVDLKSWLPDDLLIKADKMTMAASVELRVPLLDHKLVEFCLTLPDPYRLNGNVGKVLLKRAALRWLPERIVNRKKQGFPVPISVWFRGHLHDRVSEVLLDRRSLDRGYFRPEYVRQLLAAHRSGEADNSRRILSLLILETWHRVFVDEVCPAVREVLAGDPSYVVADS